MALIQFKSGVFASRSANAKAFYKRCSSSIRVGSDRPAGYDLNGNPIGITRSTR
jgi:hypothetical protein